MQVYYIILINLPLVSCSPAATSLVCDVNELDSDGSDVGFFTV